VTASAADPLQARTRFRDMALQLRIRIAPNVGDEPIPVRGQVTISRALRNPRPLQSCEDEQRTGTYPQPSIDDLAGLSVVTVRKQLREREPLKGTVTRRVRYCSKGPNCCD